MQLPAFKIETRKSTSVNGTSRTLTCLGLRVWQYVHNGREHVTVSAHNLKLDSLIVLPTSGTIAITLEEYRSHDDGTSTGTELKAFMNRKDALELLTALSDALA